MVRTAWRRVRRPQLALLLLVAVLVIGYSVNALRDRGSSPPVRTPATVTLSSLPSQVATTVRLIEGGGPFPYPQDGVVFDNREHRLPPEARGFYHEYTVPTPGSTDRGARRIVTGKDGSYYYTDDHYETFARVDVTR